MRKIILALVLSLPLAGCASLGLKSPWAGGHFDAGVWKADVVTVKAWLKQGEQGVLTAMDALCPAVDTAKTATTDPQYVGVAQATFGVNAATKNLNNIADGLELLGKACAVRDAKTTREVILTGAQAINDAQRILALAKGSK